MWGFAVKQDLHLSSLSHSLVQLHTDNRDASTYGSLDPVNIEHSQRS